MVYHCVPIIIIDVGSHSVVISLNDNSREDAKCAIAIITIAGTD